MGLLLVAFDLTKPDQDSTGLIERLKSVGPWWHGLESIWIVRTELTTVQLRDALAPYLDSSDRLLVLDVTGDAGAWWNVSKKTSDWLLEQLAR